MSHNLVNYKCNTKEEMVESYDEYENGESADSPINGTSAGTSPRSSTGSPSASSRPRDINVTNGNRAGNGEYLLILNFDTIVRESPPCRLGKNGPINTGL